MATMRIQRASRRSVLTTLSDCKPPQSCITAFVQPGRANRFDVYVIAF
jgi:hypothetical protein